MSKDIAKWEPIDSDISILTTLVHRLGLDERYVFEDVYGLDDELLQMVQGKPIAVLIQFPLTPSYKALLAEKDKEISAKQSEISPKLFYTKQLISNT